MPPPHLRSPLESNQPSFSIHVLTSVWLLLCRSQSAATCVKQLKHAQSLMHPIPKLHILTMTLHLGGTPLTLMGHCTAGLHHGLSLILFNLEHPKHTPPNLNGILLKLICPKRNFFFSSLRTHSQKKRDRKNVNLLLEWFRRKLQMTQRYTIHKVYNQKYAGAWIWTQLPRLLFGDL